MLKEQSEVEQTYARLKQQVTDRGPWQQTATGGAFFLGDPRADEVNLIDVAVALSHQCRYNGHVDYFYSVAQHAYMISKWMEEDGYSAQYALAGLHHDSGEAYLGDIISQVKFIVPEIKRVEERVDLEVHKALGVVWTPMMHSTVKQYDFIALATEVRDILGPNSTPFSWGNLPAPREEKLIPMAPDQARECFIVRHMELTAKIKEETANV